MLQNVENSTVSLGARDTHSASQVKYCGQTVLGNVYLEAGTIQVSFFSNSGLAPYALCAYCIALLSHLLCFSVQKWQPSFSVMPVSLVRKFTVFRCGWSNSADTLLVRNHRIVKVVKDL